MKERKIRTCLGCGKRCAKNELMKFVLHEGMVKLDSSGTGQGRSAYCCNDKKCLGVFFQAEKENFKGLSGTGWPNTFRVEGLGVKNE